MTVITVIDRPCGFGKSTDLIRWIKTQKTSEKFLLVVPELGEVDRFLDALGSKCFETPIVEKDWVNEGYADNKTDVLIDILSRGKNVVITHALYERIKKFQHLLADYNVIVDEVPTVAKQVPTMFGLGVFKNLLHNKKYIKIDPFTQLITATSNWIVDAPDYTEGTDNDIRKFMSVIQSADVYFISGTYCLMPLPEAFFTEPKTLRILTSLFEGTQLEHYMIKRGYAFYLHTDPNELAQFKVQMNINLKVYMNTAKIKAGYEAMTSKDAKNRKIAGNFIKNTMQMLKKEGLEFPPEFTLIACSKDAWFGKDENPNSNVTRLKTLTRLGNATYTAMITRGTNKFKDRNVLIMLGKVNLNPGLAEYLNMKTKKAKDQHALSELIQLIYRTGIRDQKEVFFITADEENIRLLKEFLKP